MREIVLDTETTGLDPEQGHKVIEIGAVELHNHIPTGRTLQLYINPERDIPPESVAVHGITAEFLKDKPVFSQVYTQFLDFIGQDSTLVIHNAEFDMKFINSELKQVGHSPLPWSRALDTAAMARKKFPGSPANLDALCRRFNIDNSNRTFHGALLDSELLAEVYLELLGGRQHGLGLVVENASSSSYAELKPGVKKALRPARPHGASAEELAAHEEMLKDLQDPLWKKTGGQG
ncbi:MAG: DNA polymerase III subunit epsilon [Rhodospirillales bacterium]|nr:DNA polymerase III subunit epsilon [Alphaproteobacteria bacterium]MCB9977587.1 DNA polymerase III subunit epsilon [Rhodospirillales bacterium]